MFFCNTSLSRNTILTAAALAVVASLPSHLHAQSFVGAPATYAPTSVSEPAPASSPAATPDVPQPKSSAWHETAVPSDKLISARVHEGVLSIDGLVAKVQLNYTIHDAAYLYFYIPGVGTAVVSQVQMTNSVKIKDAFHGSTLAFQAGGHSFELASKGTILSEDKGKADLYVHLDTNTASINRNPMVGYGNTTRAPYNWPLSAPAEKDTTAHLVQPPPIPRSMLPRVETNSTITNVVKAEDIPASSISTSAGR